MSPLQFEITHQDIAAPISDISSLLNKRLETQFHLSSETLTRFAEFSNDFSPIHISDKAAQERGFKSKVAHGVIQACVISALVGMYFPGPQSLLQQINLKFVSPCYVDDRVTISLFVKEVHQEFGVVRMKISGKKNDGTVVLKGDLQVGVDISE